MLQHFHSFNNALLASTLTLGVLLTGCGNTPDPADSTSGDAEILQTKERMAVGTDLEIETLKPISDFYYEQTGVTIDWVPLDTELFKLEDEMALQLSEDLVLPDEIDMLLMYSTHTLANAAYAHKLQAVGSDTLNERVPKQYQDPKGRWFGLSYYARTLVYNQNKVNEPELINYAGVSGKKWQDRLCMTDVMLPENQAIAKMMWNYRGSKLTPEILSNWQRNMGRPANNEQEVITQIEQGQCDVGIVNSDVFWQHAKSHPETPVRLMWANQINRGALTDAISAGLVETGEQVGQSLRFMEWLTSDEGQALLAFHTSTFPLITMTDPKINMQAVRPEWTQFEPDSTAMIDIYEDKRVIEPLRQAETDAESNQANN